MTYSMASKASFSIFLFFISLSLTSISRADDSRGPHGLATENPVAFSPSAYDFFNPNTKRHGTKNPSATSGSPLPLAAQVEASEAKESTIEETQTSHGRVGAGGIAGIAFGILGAAILAMTVFHVVKTRQQNVDRANSVKPDHV